MFLKKVQFSRYHFQNPFMNNKFTLNIVSIKFVENIENTLNI